MVKTCYPTTLKFDDGSVRVKNHQCNGSESSFIADQVFYSDGSTTKKAELSFDGSWYTANLSDYKNGLQLLRDGECVISQSGGEFTIYYPNFKGSEGVGALQLTIPQSVNPNVATSLKRLTPQGTVDVPVTYNPSSLCYEVTHSSSSQFLLINDLLVTGNEVMFFKGSIEYRWFDDGVHGVHWIYVTKQG